MKNLHLLPTDKPTRLFTSDSELLLGTHPMKTPETGKHIYITSDELIKEGDWYYLPRTNYIYKCNDFSNELNLERNFGVCKVVLTTDQDLIKDGVQEIDDEFLEWIVKNPQCKLIESCYNSLSKKCICPKEKLKGDIPQVGTTEFVTMCESVFGGKPKQETVEEAANRANGYNLYAKETKAPIFNEGFVEGVKWQAERMYSEEDLKTAFFNGVKVMGNSPAIESIFNEDYIKWFGQFKNR